MKRVASSALGLLVVLAASPAALAVSIHDEAEDLDLSGSGAAPTALVFAPGVNTVSGTTIAGDLDYLTFAVPAGYVLSQVILASFESTDDRGFIAIQNGSVFTGDPGAPDPTILLGWAHPGTANTLALLGTDILDDIGAGADAIGFTPPLGPGDYAVWTQQTGAQLIGYSYDFVVTPEPASGALLGLGLAGMLFARRYR